MTIFLAITYFIGAWLIFVFSFYQGLSQMKQQINRVAEKYETTILTDYPRVSPWYWIFPPLKLYLERRRVFAIQSHTDMSEKNLKTVVHFLDTASAWFYVSLGGLFEAMPATYQLLRALPWKYHNWVFVIIVVTLYLVGLLSNIYRVSQVRDKRKVNQRIRQRNKFL